MDNMTMIFTFVIILSVFQLVSMFCLMKYAQSVNKQVELNSEYVGRLLKFIEKLGEKHPELDTSQF